MAIEGEEEPERVAEPLLGYRVHLHVRPKPVRAGGRRRIGDLFAPRESAAHQVLIPKPHRQVPRNAVTAPAGRYVMRTCAPVDAYRGERHQRCRRRRTARSVPVEHRELVRERHRGRPPIKILIEATKKYECSPRQRHVPGRQRVDGTVEGPCASRQNPIEGANTSTGTSERAVFRPNDTAAGPYAAAARRPRTGMSTRYTPRPRFKNLLGLLPRLPAWRHAPPIRRLRVRRRCPRAAMSTRSGRSARAARSPGGVAGGDVNKISPSSPLEGSARERRAARSSCRRSLPGPQRGRRRSSSYEFEPWRELLP